MIIAVAQNQAFTTRHLHLLLVDNGGMVIPSTAVVKVVSYAERIYTICVSEKLHNSITRKNLKERMFKVSKHFVDISDVPFQQSRYKFSINQTLFDNHQPCLIKCFGKYLYEDYLQMRNASTRVVRERNQANVINWTNSFSLVIINESR